jgi:hypothetical protein
VGSDVWVLKGAALPGDRAGKGGRGEGDLSGTVACTGVSLELSGDVNI